MRQKLNYTFSQYNMDAINAVRNLCANIRGDIICGDADSLTFCEKSIDEKEIRTYSEDEIYAFTKFLEYLKEVNQNRIDVYLEGEDR